MHGGVFADLRGDRGDAGRGLRAGDGGACGVHGGAAAQEREAFEFLAPVIVLQLSEAPLEGEFSRVQGAGGEQSQRMQSSETIEARAQVAMTGQSFGQFVMANMLNKVGREIERKGGFGEDALRVVTGLAMAGIGVPEPNQDSDGTLVYPLERFIDGCDELLWLRDAPPPVVATITVLDPDDVETAVWDFALDSAT
jgi:hypothetical protein